MDDTSLDPVDIGKPCEICGDVGYAAIIRICCKCKITREHVYCMRIKYEGEEDKWICEDCDPANQISSSKLAPIEQPKDKGTRFNIKKPPQNTKVQYITPEEARVLESGAMKKNTSSPSKVKSTLFPKRDSTRCPISPPKSSVKQNPQFGPPGYAKPLSDRIRATNALRENQSAVRDKEIDVTQKQRACKEAAGATGFPARKSQTSNAAPGKETGLVRQSIRESPSTKPLPPGSSLRQNAEDNNISLEHLSPDSMQSPPVVSSGLVREPIRESPSTKPLLPGSSLRQNAEDNNISSEHLPPDSMQSPPVVSSGNDIHANSQQKSCDPEGREPLEVKLEIDRYLPNHPAIYPTWMGRFDIRIDSLPFGSFDAIRAYPPCKVHRKAYDMSKQLPNALQLQPLPRLSVWLDLFKGDGPCALDIGLYFLSSKRPEQSYTTLLEFLDAHDMLLRCLIDGVELWVFSSKHLQRDSQRINQSFFLWGLFRLDSALPKATDMTPPGSGELDDMDIDMEGGYDMLDRFDLVVQKPKEAKLDEEASTKAAADAALELSPQNRETPDTTEVPYPSTKVEDDAALELTPQKREITDTTEVTRPLIVPSLPDELDFERELQNSFNRFVKLMKSEV